MSQSLAMSAQYFRRQAKYWFLAAIIIAIVWLVVWLTSAAPSLTNKAGEEEQVAAALPTRIDHFVDLAKEVRPIDFSTIVRDMRSYPAEFKDKLYYENMGNRYTIELMDVLENEVIVDYLEGVTDRQQYAYFRYLDKEKRPHYVLTYGKFQTAEEAQQNITTNNFGLPQSLKPKAVKAADYLKIIDNYMRAEGIADLATNQPRRIILNATNKEIPVQAATRADEDLVRRSYESQAKVRSQLARQQEYAKHNEFGGYASQPAEKQMTAPTHSAPTPAPSEQSTPLTEAPAMAPTAKPTSAPVQDNTPKPTNFAPTPKPDAMAPTAKPTAEAQSVPVEAGEQ